MEKRLGIQGIKTIAFVLILTVMGGVAFAAGLLYGSQHATAAEQAPPKKTTRIIYPKKTDLDFEGTEIQGEVRSPGEFYFQRKPEEEFDSLVKRRPNFHREMLRDVVLSR
jgi:hypothetical protein